MNTTRLILTTGAVGNLPNAVRYGYTHCCSRYQTDRCYHRLDLELCIDGLIYHYHASIFDTKGSKGVSVEDDLIKSPVCDPKKKRDFMHLILTAYQKETIVFPLALGEF